MKYNLDLPKEVIAELSKTPHPIEKVIEHIVLRDYEMQHKMKRKVKQHDRTTKFGLIERAYDNNVKQMDLPSKAKWFKRWNKSKRLDKMFKAYEASGFQKELVPSFVYNEYSGRLEVIEFKNRKGFKYVNLKAL